MANTPDDTANDTADSGTTIDTSTLRGAAAASGRTIGTAVECWPLNNDAVYGPLLAEQFGGIVPANALKWTYVQLTRDTWDFSQADAILASAAANGQRRKGHTLVWTRLQGTTPLSVTGALQAATLSVEGPAVGVDLYVDDVSMVPDCE